MDATVFEGLPFHLLGINSLDVEALSRRFASGDEAAHKYEHEKQGFALNELGCRTSLGTV